jgi:4-amino-4-deoxy-L-arabinose transferase-like glycosyltransferase
MARALVLIFIIILALTLPFINRPLHLDDVLFIYSASSLNKNIFLPYNFFFPAESRLRFGFAGFTNPPLNSYIILLISKFFGSEPIILHLFFSLFAVFAAFSIFFLSSLFVRNKFLATLMSITTPVFILQSHTLMPDMLFVGFWSLSVYFYIKGQEKQSGYLMFSGALFISLAILTRYSGFLLIPLLFFYSFLKRKKTKGYMLFLLLPIFMFILWCLHNMYFYGRPHILSPILISREFYVKYSSILPRLILNLIYIGSLIIYPVFFTTLFLLKERYHKKRYFCIAICLYLHGLFYVSFLTKITFNRLFYAFVVSFSFLFLVWVFRYLNEFKNTNREFYKFEDDLFLISWAIIIIMFHSFAYFSAPKFSLLIVPAIIFLLFRLLERKYNDYIRYSKFLIFISVSLGLAISMADYNQVIFDRREISRVLHKYSEKYKTTIWLIDQDRGWGYYVPESFSAIYAKHNFKEDDLILGMPFFSKDIIQEKKLEAKELETIWYKMPIIRVCDLKNNIYLYFDGYGKYLPYSLSFKKVPMFVIFQVASKI